MQLFANRYELFEKLGEGGMGVVYRALDRLTGQPVAVKQISSNASHLFLSSDESEELRLSLGREFQILASLRHPNIIHVTDYGLVNSETPYYAMALLTNYQTIREAAYQVSEDKKIDLFVQLLRAVTYIHRQGIIHRDLKPGNVLVSNGQVKLVDFGLSIQKETVIQRIVGTVHYLAPEIFRHQPPTIATDLYAVGVIAYEMFLKRRPFGSENISDLIREIMEVEPSFSQLEIAQDALPPDHPTMDASTDATAIVRIVDEVLPDTVVVEEEDTQPGTDGVSKPKTSTTETQEIKLARRDTQEKAALSPILNVIWRLLRKNPAERYAHAEDAVLDLATLLNKRLPIETRAVRESFLQAAQFVGREKEKTKLAAAVKDVVAGQGSFWLVSGESGVGKSRLMDEIDILARLYGTTVLRGQAVKNKSFPYEVWQQPLRQLLLMSDVSNQEASTLKYILPTIETIIRRPVEQADSLGGTADQDRIIGTIIDIFERQNGPMVLFLDDIQWIKEGLLPLQQLIDVVQHRPLLVIVAYRSDERPGLKTELPTPNIIDLTRFTDEEIMVLAESMLGEAIGRSPEIIEFLKRETEGNAFFIVEMVRALAEVAGQLQNVGKIPLPEQLFPGGVREIVHYRLNKLAEPYRPLLAVAAVMGRQFDVDILKHLLQTRPPYLSTFPTDMSINQWLTLSASFSILEDLNAEWRFSHDKLREAVVTHLEPDELRKIHALIAEATETLHPNDVAYANNLLYHWQQSEHREKQIYYSLISSEQALSISSYHDAIKHGNNALVLLQSTGDEWYRARFTDILGKAYIEMGNLKIAKQYLEQSIEAAHELGDMALEASPLTTLGWLMKESGMPELAITHLQRALHLAESVEDERAMADALVQLGVAIHQLNALDTALVHYQRGLEIYQLMHHHPGMTRALNGIAAVHVMKGNFAAGIKYLKSAMKSAHLSGDRWMEAMILSNMGEISMRKGDYITANDYAQRALAIARQVGSTFLELMCHTNLAEIAIRQEDLETARLNLIDGLKIAVKFQNIPEIIILTAHSAHYFVKRGSQGHALEFLSYATANIPAKTESHQLVESIRDIAIEVFGKQAVYEELALPVTHPAFDYGQRVVTLLEADTPA